MALLRARAKVRMRAARRSPLSSDQKTDGKHPIDTPVTPSFRDRNLEIDNTFLEAIGFLVRWGFVGCGEHKVFFWAR